jgi:hypothetical protein
MGLLTGEMPLHHSETLGLVDSGSGEECEVSNLDVPDQSSLRRGVVYSIFTSSAVRSECSPTTLDK